MSYYFQYNFVSPEPTFALIKEELKSYIDTGSIDDLLFNTYLDKCLKKLGRSSYIINGEVLHVNNFEARLPDNFYAVREAWRCTEIHSGFHQDANSFYSQTDDPTTILIAPLTTGEDPAQDCQHHPNCHNDRCHGECLPDLIQPVYKTNRQTSTIYRREYLLKPGNISARKNCDVEYTKEWDFHTAERRDLNQFTPDESAYDSFDIRDNKFVVTFREGPVHLLFYATEYDGIGNQMIPDNYRIKEFVEAFIKFKMFETLTNQTNDETFNQLQQKLVYYKQQADEAFIMANNEILKQTVWQKQRQLKKDLNRFNMYELPNRTNIYGRRRNN